LHYYLSKSCKEIQAKQGSIGATTLKTKSDHVFLVNKGSLKALNTLTLTRKFISALMTSKLGKSYYLMLIIFMFVRHPSDLLISVSVLCLGLKHLGFWV
jgi:hypothetical protein